MGHYISFTGANKKELGYIQDSDVFECQSKGPDNNFHQFLVDNLDYQGSFRHFDLYKIDTEKLLEFAPTERLGWGDINKLVDNLREYSENGQISVRYESQGIPLTGKEVQLEYVSEGKPFDVLVEDTKGEKSKYVIANKDAVLENLSPKEIEVFAERWIQSEFKFIESDPAKSVRVQPWVQKDKEKTFNITFSEGRPGEPSEEMTFEYSGSTKEEALANFWSDNESDYRIDIINIEEVNKKNKGISIGQ